MAFKLARLAIDNCQPKAKTNELRNMEASINTLMDEATGKLKEFHEKLSRMKELEPKLILTELQFTRAVVESDASSSRVVAYNNNMSELMMYRCKLQPLKGKRKLTSNTEKQNLKQRIWRLNWRLLKTT